MPDSLRARLALLLLPVVVTALLAVSGFVWWSQQKEIADLREAQIKSIEALATIQTTQSERAKTADEFYADTTGQLNELSDAMVSMGLAVERLATIQNQGQR